MWWVNESGSALGSGSDGFNNTTGFGPDDNFSCAARNIQGSVQQPYNDILVTVVRVLQSILFFIASFGGILLNAFIVTIVAKYKQLHTISFGIAAHISALDILFSVIILLAMTNSIANRWLLGEHMCGILGASTHLVSVIRTVALLIFVVDRFLSVFVPFGYPKYQKRVVIISSLGSWSVILIVIVVGYILDCYEFVPFAWMCFISTTCSNSCSVLVVINHITVTAPSILVPIFLYAMLYNKAKKSKKAMSLATGEDGKNSYDWKATTTFFFMFLATFLLTLPNILTAVLIRSVFVDNVPLAAYLVETLGTRSITFVPVADAIALLRNRDVKDIIKEIKEYTSHKCCKKCKL